MHAGAFLAVLIPIRTLAVAATGDGRVDWPAALSCATRQRKACSTDNVIVCHATLAGDNAVCRGFYERHATLPLIVARAMGVIRYS
jgi:hypothetical protein